MRTYIFSDSERKLLENSLISAKTENAALHGILRKIRENKVLFDDIYLYLRVRKTMIG